jgi:hypothetical protein
VIVLTALTYQVRVTMFSRSFVLHILSRDCPKHFLKPLSRPSRYFSSGAARHAILPKSAEPRVPSQSKPGLRLKLPPYKNEVALKFAERRPESLGTLQRKVVKQGNIELYRAPSHISYRAGAYGIAAFCFVYSAYHCYITFLGPKSQLPIWQKTLFGGISVAMSALGAVFVFKTSRLVRTLTAVNSHGRTYLRFTVRSMIPFRKPWEFEVSPSQVTFTRQAVVSADGMASLNRQRAHSQNVMSEVNFFKAPLKKLSFGFWRIFRSVRQLFTEEGIVLLEVEGQKGSFRMDLHGFVSEDLRLLGNPIRTKYL